MCTCYMLPEFHLRCDTCQQLGSHHGRRDLFFHTSVSRHWWDSKLGSIMPPLFDNVALSLTTLYCVPNRIVLNISVNTPIGIRFITAWNRSLTKAHLEFDQNLTICLIIHLFWCEHIIQNYIDTLLQRSNNKLIYSMIHSQNR